MNRTVDVIIPTYKPGKELKELLGGLTKQTYPIQKIILMNTEEEFWDSRWVEGVPQAEVHHLKKCEFDHGGTRDAAARMSDSDLIIFTTHDAVCADSYLIENLAKEFQRKDVKAAYARQLPDKNCKTIERYTRSFNYPKESRVKSLADLPELGIKTFFCSNVCAAYDRETYFKLGGFTKHTIFNEDMIYAGHLIQAGFQIAYAADAKVIHSHNYGNLQQFKRNFDLAVSQADHPEVFQHVKSENEGIQLVKRTAAYLFSIRKPWLIADLVCKSCFKLMGYRLGKVYRYLPKFVILSCTMNRAYWTYKK